MSLVDDLKAAKALIAEPGDWGSGLDSHCAAWAVGEAVGDQWSERKTEVIDYLAQHLPPTAKRGFEPIESVVQFNDAATTTHADIMALFDRAIAAAEASAS